MSFVFLMKIALSTLRNHSSRSSPYVS